MAKRDFILEHIAEIRLTNERSGKQVLRITDAQWEGLPAMPVKLSISSARLTLVPPVRPRPAKTIFTLVAGASSGMRVPEEAVPLPV